MNPLKNFFTRIALLAWAKSGKAPGFLYPKVEQLGRTESSKKRLRVTSNGLRFECDLRDHIQQKIYFYGAYEPIEVSLLLSMLGPGDVVVDAGANIGFYTLMMAKKVGASGAVHSFEPVASNFKVLGRHVLLNDSPSQIFLNEKALWNESKTLEFKIDANFEFNPGGYSSGKVENPVSIVSCPAVTLADYFAATNINRLDAIKMDIEGAELFALQGAKALLEKFHPTILLEISPITCAGFDYKTEDLWNFLKQFGYRIYKIDSVNKKSKWVENFDGIDQRNVLLIHPSRVDQFDDRWDDKAITKIFLQYSK